MINDGDAALESDSNKGGAPGLSFSLGQIWRQITSYNSLEVIGDNGTDGNPIIIMGYSYTNVKEAEEKMAQQICLTYRFGFEPIPRSVNGPNPLTFLGSMVFSKNMLLNNGYRFHELMDKNNFTSDVGWGCMIRTSQSLLANAFLRLLYFQDDKRVIDLFQDNTSSPFSLHNFIAIAGELPLKVQPGEWFGPNAASLSILRLCERYSNIPDLPKLKVLISENGDLYDDQILKLFTQDLLGLLILFPVRLGIEKINNYYHKSLLHFLSLKQSVGIAGGKPSSSFYFIGYHNHDLYYLDPHFCQNYLDDNIQYDTYHSHNYQTLNITNLDPSMMIGILLTDYSDYSNFQTQCNENGNIIVHFHKCIKTNSKRRPSDFVNISEEDVRDDFVDIHYAKDEKTSEDDEFVDLNQELDEEVLVELPVDESYEAINHTPHTENES